MLKDLLRTCQRHRRGSPSHRPCKRVSGGGPASHSSIQGERRQFSDKAFLRQATANLLHIWQWDLQQGNTLHCKHILWFSRQETWYLHLEQIHLLRQELMGRILWEPKTKESNAVQVIASAPSPGLHIAGFQLFLQYRPSHLHWDGDYCILDSLISSLECRGPKRTNNSNLHQPLLLDCRQGRLAHKLYQMCTVCSDTDTVSPRQ